MPTLSDAFLVFSGGGVGSLLRWTLALALSPLPSPLLPWATLFVNLGGSFAIGFLSELVGAERLPREARLALVTGLLGGFTTFSAFALESAEYFRIGQSWRAILYPALSVSLGILVCLVGIRLGKS
jgi:fluoride exporter